MGRIPDDQPASRVIEEPKRNVLPYIAVAFVAAVAAWSILQQDNSAPSSSREPPQSPPAREVGRSQDVGPGAAKGDLRTLFSADDYPAQAQVRGEEGTVRVELTVDTHGRVSRCRVLQSSQSETLDAATCQILQRRARFTPARDASGRAVVDTVTTPPIVWRLEG